MGAAYSISVTGDDHAENHSRRAYTPSNAERSISSENIVIYDCCPSITISSYCQGNVWKQTYVLYAEAYFPFAYAELYSLIRYYIVKYVKKD